MHGAVVNAGARVGRNCILNSQSLVEHDARDRRPLPHRHGRAPSTAASASATAHSSAAAAACGRAVRIGERCVIGMGQRVLADCADAHAAP